MSTYRKLIRIILLLAVVGSASANDLSRSDQLRLIGRFLPEDSATLAFTWPGSALEYRFRGSETRISLSVPERMRFWLEVDGQGRELWVEPEQTSYTLAKFLSPVEHHIKITRLAESFSGVAKLHGLPETDGKLLRAPQPAGRKLLVIGDSITAGYGIEGESKDCAYSQDTSNPLKTYAALAARELGAELHSIAWSGIGVWRGYGEQEPKSPTIAERRQLILADDFSHRWNTARYQPDAVIIAIGTNDFWQGTAPGYREAMGKMLADIRTDYPDAMIYFMVSPMLTGKARELQAEDLSALATARGVAVLDLGRIQPGDGYGCDWHPNEITNTRMAGHLISRLRKDLAWN